VGAQDASLAGNVVALPLNPASALFHNPAQLTLLPNSATMGILGIRYHPRYANSLGYDNTSREFPLAPTLGYVTDHWAPVHVGIGMYGSLGFSYNFDANPSRGVPNNFFTELAVISLAPAIAYSPTPNLHVGVALNPSYGRLRFKSPSPVGRIDVDVRGPGIFGTLGLLYTPTPKLSLGVSYKTPGTIFMFGNARVAGGGDDARIDFQFPQQLEFGVAYRVTDRLTVTAQARWAEFSVFEDTSLRFDERSFLNRSAVNDARDRFRLGAGLQWVIFPGITWQVGFSWERWAIKSSSLAPTLPDWTEYYMFPMGITIERGLWEIHVLAGQSYAESRPVSASQNPFFSGRYALDQAIFGLQFTRKFGGSDSSE
jgi:long-subunit fatty acid transport protein